jgi:phage shock protein E
MINISPQEVMKAINNHQPMILLDVRTKGEYARGKIAGAINLPVDEVESRIEQILPDKNATIYVYCLSASRSPFAVGIMEKLGYQHVFNMDPGLLGWRVFNYPTDA